MKPMRVAMTDNLICNYGLVEHMNSFVNYTYYSINKDLSFVHEIMHQKEEDLFTGFHSQEYVDIIKIITPENKC